MQCHAIVLGHVWQAQHRIRRYRQSPVTHANYKAVRPTRSAIIEGIHNGWRPREYNPERSQGGKGPLRERPLLSLTFIFVFLCPSFLSLSVYRGSWRIICTSYNIERGRLRRWCRPGRGVGPDWPRPWRAAFFLTCGKEVPPQNLPRLSQGDFIDYSFP